MAIHGVAPNKIKLSEAQTSDTAIDLLSQYVVNTHALNATPIPTSHFAFAGANTSTLWSALLSYLDGAAVEWIKEKNHSEIDDRFVINYSLIEEFLVNALEVDLDLGGIALLPQDHPLLDRTQYSGALANGS